MSTKLLMKYIFFGVLAFAMLNIVQGLLGENGRYQTLTTGSDVYLVDSKTGRTWELQNGRGWVYRSKVPY